MPKIPGGCPEPPVSALALELLGSFGEWHWELPASKGLASPKTSWEGGRYLKTTVGLTRKESMESEPLCACWCFAQCLCGAAALQQGQHR